MKKERVIQETRHASWAMTAKICELRNGRHDDDTWTVSSRDEKKLTKAARLLGDIRRLLEGVE